VAPEKRRIGLQHKGVEVKERGCSVLLSEVPTEGNDGGSSEEASGLPSNGRVRIR
jgi:hypothetical protein